MSVYLKLGGVKWLLQFAKDNPAEFLRQGLSRLLPAPQRDDPDFVQNNQFNFDSLSTLESARRVAFALNAGLIAQRELAPVAEVVPEVEAQNPNAWRPPTDAPDMPPPDDNRTRWAAELPLTPQARADQAVVRDTVESDITTYRGGAGEQGGSSPRQPAPSSSRKPTVAEIRRRQLL
ncbi:hypothetical protein [Pseudomonas sp. NPDC086251]|uniref:hypothetical protein n=1 Tax=Pseudomonas sp. NPDC086251 TaxID=3364431 RepID=UPI003837B3C5